MTKRCPHCDGEIRPSVVKCRHCGKSVNDPPEAPPAGAEAGEQVSAGVSPPAAAVEAALDPVAPPVGVAFTPPVAVLPTQPPPGPPAAAVPSVAVTAPASAVQDWGSPDVGKVVADPYWQVKRTIPAAAPNVGAQAEAERKKTDPKIVVSAILLLCAGVAAIAASLQPWITLSANGLKEVADQSRRGFAGWEGKATVILGVVCIAVSLMSLVRKDAGPLKVGVVAGLGIAAVGLYTVLTATSQFSSTLVAAREVAGMREEAARGLVTGWFESGALKVSSETGLYAAIAVGVIALLGGLLAFSVRPAAAPDPRSSAPMS